MSSFEAARGDVVFEANTGRARLGIEELRREFQQTTGAMSTEALRAAAAQEKLDRAIARHGPQSLAAKQATIAYRRELQAVQTQSAATSVGVNRLERDVGKLGRGALSGTGLLHGLGRAAAFASTGFLGGAGVVYAVRAFTKAAEEHGAVEAQLGAALKAQGVNYSQYKQQIDAALRSQEQLSGFTEQETVPAFTRIVRTTGDVGSGLKYLSLASDIARGSGISLASAANVVNKALAGQTAGLRRLGVEIPKGATGYQGLEIAQKKFAGSTAAFAGTAAGAQARLNVAIKQTEINLGTALLPTVTRLNTRLTNWLDNSKNQARLQHDLNTAVKDGTAIINGIRDALHAADVVVGPLIKDVGGLKNATELLIGAMAVGKVLKFAGALGKVAGALSLGGPAAAVTAEGELAGIGGAAAVSAGQVSGLRLALLALGGADVAAAVAAVGGVLAAKGDQGPTKTAKTLQTYQEQYPLYSAFLRSPAHNYGLYEEVLAQSRQVARGTLTPAAVEAYLRQNEKELLKAGVITQADVEHEATLSTSHQTRAAGAAKASSKFAPTTGPKPVPGLTAAQELQVGLAANPRNLALLQTQAANDRASIAQLQKLRAVGKLTNAEYVTEVTTIYADLASTESAITQIQQAAAAKTKAAEARSAAAERRRQADAAATARRQAAAYRSALTTRAQAFRDQVTIALRGERAGIGTRLSGTTVTATGASYAEPAAEKSLITLLKRETNDKRLTTAERARYHHLYITELGREQADEDSFNKQVTAILRKAREKEAAHLKQQQDLRDAILQNRLSRAQLAETRAGSNSAAVTKARRAEIAAELAILADEKRQGAKLTGLAKQQNIAAQLATEQAIAQLRQQLNPTVGGDARANEAQFLASFKEITGKFGGNTVTVPTGKIETHGFETVHELRRVNAHLSTITAHGKTAASRYGSDAALAAFG